MWIWTVLTYYLQVISSNVGWTISILLYIVMVQLQIRTNTDILNIKLRLNTVYTLLVSIVKNVLFLKDSLFTLIQIMV